MQIQINRSIDTAYPKIQGIIPFTIIKKEERSKVCGQTPEAFVIDTEEEWTHILERIPSVYLPKVDFSRDTVLAYFWGEKRYSGNTFSINQVKAESDSSSVTVSLEFNDGPLDALSCPFIMATIPKTSHGLFIFVESD